MPGYWAQYLKVLRLLKINIESDSDAPDPCRVGITAYFDPRLTFGNNLFAKNF